MENFRGFGVFWWLLICLLWVFFCVLWGVFLILFGIIVCIGMLFGVFLFILYFGLGRGFWYCGFGGFFGVEYLKII